MTLLQSRHNPQYQLSQQDLLAIGEEISQTYPPQATEQQANKFLQSKYSPQCDLLQQDLLDISSEITQNYAPHILLNEPELVLMPVDPLNLYAYWNLNTEAVDKQLLLRVYSLPECSDHPSNTKLRFDVNVEGLQNQQKIHLPIAAMAYSAVIGELNADGSLRVLSKAETIHVPRVCPATKSVNHIDEQIELKIVDVPQEEIFTEHEQIDENIGQTVPLFVNELIPQVQIEPDIIHVMYENPEVKHSHYDSNEAHLHVSAADTNEFAGRPHAEPAVLMIKNFNDYGYDLMVYEYDGAAPFAMDGAQQNCNIKRHHNIKAIVQNASGLGFN